MAENLRRSRRVALYYPYVHFRSREWLRASLLYYDQLSRIVPPGLKVDAESYYREFVHNPRPLLSDISALKDNDFLVEDSPEPYISSVANEFLDFAMDNLTDPKRRASLVPQLARLGSFYTIHPGKIDGDLAEILIELKLAHKKQGDRWSDLDIEPVTGGLYMLFLANQMAGRRNLVSDSSVYQSLMYQKVATPALINPAKRGGEFRLATAVLRTAIPTALGEVPLDKLLRVRGDLSGQRRRFQDKIAGLARELEQVESEDALQECIETHQRKLEDEYQELVDKLRSVNLSFATGLFSVSVPAWATAAWGLRIATVTPLLAGIGAVAISSVVMKSVFDRRAALRTHPLAYLLNLRKRVTARSMARGIISLNLSLPVEEGIADPRVPIERDSGAGGGSFDRRRFIQDIPPKRWDKRWDI
jgi:hypothetical protein